MFIAKKNKKIELVLPLTAEFHIMDLDSLNFLCYWDPANYDTMQGPSSGSRSDDISSTTTFKVKVLCNHAGEKKALIERMQNIKQYVPKEPNTFAN